LHSAWLLSAISAVFAILIVVIIGLLEVLFVGVVGVVIWVCCQRVHVISVVCAEEGASGSLGCGALPAALAFLLCLSGSADHAVIFTLALCHLRCSSCFKLN
jgi:maltodextrin utilization protein YvdJ